MYIEKGAADTVLSESALPYASVTDDNRCYSDPANSENIDVRNLPNNRYRFLHAARSRVLFNAIFCSANTMPSEAHLSVDTDFCVFKMQYAS